MDSIFLVFLALLENQPLEKATKTPAFESNLHTTHTEAITNSGISRGAAIIEGSIKKKIVTISRVKNKNAPLAIEVFISNELMQARYPSYVTLRG